MNNIDTNNTAQGRKAAFLHSKKSHYSSYSDGSYKKDVSLAPTGLQGITQAVYRGNNGFDFIGPAEQAIATRSKNPGWRTVDASRTMGNFPYWERNDVFRMVKYQDFQNLPFLKMHVSSPSGIILSSGKISYENIIKGFDMNIPHYIKYNHNVVKIFSILFQFDTMTEQQIRVMAGLSEEETSKSLSILYALKIVDTNNIEWREQKNLGRIWRLISRRDKRVREYFDGLPPIQKIIIAGKPSIGDEKQAPGSGSRSSVKHNLFAVETMLRVAESAPNVCGIWGDPFMSEEAFHKIDPNAINRGSWGDGAIITKNGTIVVLEVVGSVINVRGKAQTIAEKAASWVGAIANSPLDINVIFVNTTWESDWEVMTRSLKYGINHASKKYAPDEYSRKKALNHIGVIDARRWFPEPGTCSFMETCLGVYVPSLRAFRRFDVPDPSYCTVEKRRDIVMNTVTAMHTPEWMGNIIKPRYGKSEDRYDLLEKQYKERGILYSSDVMENE